MLATAGRGALAGLIGGVALAATDRLIVPRLGGGAPRSREWDRRVGRGARAAGIALGGRRQAAAGIASSLAVAALLGAAYAVVREHGPESGVADRLLDGALAYGVSFVVPARPRRRRGPRGVAGRVASGADDPELFRRVTTMALRLLR